MQHIVLLGLMGSGKSTVGRPLAVIMRRQFHDNDHELHAHFGSTASELADRDGVDALHAAEAAVLLDLLAKDERSVITAAASTVESPACRRALIERAFVVWLRADVDVLAAKAAEEDGRPWEADAAAQLRGQAERRHPLFAEVADLTVDTTDHADGYEIAAQLARRIKRRTTVRAVGATDR